MPSIAVDTRRRVGRIDRRIFGGFAEHLRRCVYGGLYEPGSPLADAHGFRRDVIEGTRRLGVTNVRWPGGNFVSGYHWADGVGPREKRPRRMELAWRTTESNQFGTDEFIQWCRAAGVSPFICVNMGSGTMDEAQAWVEYCNGTGDTAYADMRRANGNREPYGVKIWGLGNEVSGNWQIGAKSAESYIESAVEFAKVMKLTDPSIELVACGSNQELAVEMDWNRLVVQRLAPVADYLGIHMYVGNNDENYEDYMGTSVRIERYLRAVRGLIDGACYHTGLQKAMKVSFDEWNATPSTFVTEPHMGWYTLEDALVVAMFLNAFVRNADLVRIANQAQLVNVVPPMVTRPDGILFQSIFYPFELYARHQGTNALDAWTECETFTTARHGGVPYLDVSASHDPSTDTLTLNVINRSRDRAIPVTLDVGPGSPTGAITARMVGGADPKAHNTFDNPGAVRVREATIEISRGGATVELPPCSVTVMSMQVR